MSKTGTKIRDYKAGIFAETLAAWFLRLKGYSILESRFRTPVGEIDIIARKDNCLIFVEVKFRQTLSTAKESIHNRNQSRVTRAAEYYIMRHVNKLANKRGHNAPDGSAGDVNMRFDAIVIDRFFRMEHIQNAW